MNGIEASRDLLRHNPLRHAPQILHQNGPFSPQLHGSTEMARELFSRRRSSAIGLTGQALVKAYREGNLRETMKNEITFYHQLDIGDRGLNTLLDVVKIDNGDASKLSRFGEKLDEMREQPDFDDHNGSHSRRVEMHYEAILCSDPKTHSPQVSQWLGSGYLFTGFHDAGQLLAEKRNIEEQRIGTPQELNVKKGHGLEASVTVLALTKRIAEAKKISLEEAWKEARGAAYITMEHDDLIGFSNGTDNLLPAYTLNGETRIPLDDAILYKLFKERKLDRGSLSPNDLMRLLRITKREGGFIDENDAHDLGMDRDFQKEYASELAALSNDNNPIMADITKEDRRGLDVVAQAAVTADILDMLTPPEESITRKLSTQYSRKRPIYPDGVSADTLLQYLQEWDGHPGNGYNSDTTRILWEYLNPDIALKGTKIEDNPYLKNLLKESTIMGAIAFKNIGTQLMQGNIHVIDDLYVSRLDRVRNKALKHSGYNRSDRRNIHEEMERSGNSDEVVYDKALKKNGLVADRFINLVEQLKREAEKIKLNITQKPSKDGEGLESRSQVKIYSPDSVGEFHMLVDGVLKILCKKYSISDEELAAYEGKVWEGVYPNGIPYSSYDTLADPSRRRVLWKVPIPTL